MNGYAIRKAPLVDRKAALRVLIAKSDILFSDSFEIDGSAMFNSACDMGLEGVVSKVRDVRYHSGRTNDWVKVTCRQRETLPIAGLALDGKKFDGIYLGSTRRRHLSACSLNYDWSIAVLTLRREQSSALSHRAKWDHASLSSDMLVNIAHVLKNRCVRTLGCSLYGTP